MAVNPRCRQNSFSIISHNVIGFFVPRSDVATVSSPEKDDYATLL